MCCHCTHVIAPKLARMSCACRFYACCVYYGVVYCMLSRCTYVFCLFISLCVCIFEYVIIVACTMFCVGVGIPKLLIITCVLIICIPLCCVLYHVKKMLIHTHWEQCIPMEVHISYSIIYMPPAPLIHQFNFENKFKQREIEINFT